MKISFLSVAKLLADTYIFMAQALLYAFQSIVHTFLPKAANGQLGIPYTEEPILGKRPLFNFKSPHLRRTTRNKGNVLIKFIFLLFILSTPTSFAQNSSCKMYFAVSTRGYPLFKKSDFSNVVQLIGKGIPMKKKRPNAQELPDTTFRGMGTLAGYKAELDGTSVFVKIPTRNVYEQAFLYKTLGDLNIGPKLRGILTVEKHTALVLDFISGIDVSVFYDLPTQAQVALKNVHIKLSMKTYNRLLEIKNQLISIGLIDGYDIQFRFTPDGNIFVMDPEKLQFATPEKLELILKEQNDPQSISTQNPLVEINILLNSIHKVLEDKGLWDIWDMQPPRTSR